jgi:site-specific DNA-methyltransferase (adenine-specific)
MPNNSMRVRRSIADIQSDWESGANTPSLDQWGKMQEYLSLPPYTEAIRPFNATPDAPYTDVWTFPTVQGYAGKHPCEKPLEMLEHIIAASSRPGAVVLDCFAGSGNTLVAAKKLGRHYIGIDIDPHWVDVTKGKLGQTQSFVSTEDRLQWLETQVSAQGAKLRKIQEKQQLSLFDQGVA